MAAVWASLTPLIVAGLVLPSFLIAEVLLLRSEGGRAKTVAFVSGFVVTKLAQGLVFGILLSGANRGAPHAISSTISGTVLVIAGIIFYAMAAEAIFLHGAAGEGITRLFGAMDTVTSWRAFGIGIAAVLTSMRLWVFTLGAVAVIQEGDLSRLPASLTFVAFVVLSLAPMIVIAIIPFVATGRPDAVPGALHAWLAREHRWILAGLGLVLGTALLLLGLGKLGVF